MIELKSICAGYGPHRVLHDLSAVFHKGQLTSIIGVNGCGKSTLVKAVLGMIPLSAGQITYDGCPLDGMTRGQIALRAAYLAQGRSVPDMTVEQLVLHGRFPHLSYPRRYTAQDRSIAQAAMERMGVAPFACRPLHTLSGGMRQNACIAMALAQDTDYILLDEPTTYLDIAHQLTLMKTLRGLADSGKGILAVMHDLPLAFTFSDRVVLVHNGVLAADGTPQELCSLGVPQRIFGLSVELSADGKTYGYRYFP